MATIREQVKEIIVSKLGIEPEEVVESAIFTRDLGADSLDTVELIMEFERTFGITIPDTDTDKIITVGDAMNYVEKCKQ